MVVNYMTEARTIVVSVIIKSSFAISVIRNLNQLDQGNRTPVFLVIIVIFWVVVFFFAFLQVCLELGIQRHRIHHCLVVIITEAFINYHIDLKYPKPTIIIVLVQNVIMVAFITTMHLNPATTIRPIASN